MDQLAKITARLPKTEGANGLNKIANDLLAEPEGIHYLIVAVDCGSVNTTYQVDDFGEPYTETVPSARIRAIEPLDGGDAKVAKRLMDQARGERTGRPALDLEFDVSDVTG
jgi:hypothetical protein